MIQSDPILSDLFPKLPLVVYKRDTNLNDHLVHSRLRSPSQDSSALGTRPCKNSKSKICSHVNPATTIRGPMGAFTIRRLFNCQSTDVIYAVICSFYSDTTTMLYVGKTCRSLSAVGEEHLRSARLGYDIQVGKTFSTTWAPCRPLLKVYYIQKSSVDHTLNFHLQFAPSLAS